MEKSHQSAGNGSASGQAVESGPLAGFSTPGERIDLALRAVSEISDLTEALDRYAADDEVPAKVVQLFNRRIYTLACVVMSSLGDKNEVVDEIVARTFPKSIIEGEAAHG